MSHDFSDPLTSKAYASSKGSAGHDPLLLPSNTAGATNSTGIGTAPAPTAVPTYSNSRVTHGGKETAVSTTKSPQQKQQQQQQSYDPLSFSPSSRNSSLLQSSNPQGMDPNSDKSRPLLAPAAVAGNKMSPVAHTPANDAPAQAIKRRATPVKQQESATARTTSAHTFEDPLVFNNPSIGVIEPASVNDDSCLFTSGGLPKNNDIRGYESSSKSFRAGEPQQHRTTAPSFSASHTHGSNSSDFRNAVPSTISPPLSPTFDSSAPGAERERTLRRESPYDQQRVKAPQYLHITIPDTNRRGKDGMFLLSVQTNLPRYKRQSYTNVTRSYLEFARLREHLLAEHPETIVPVLPPERSLNNAADLQSMRIFLDRISRHSVLSQDYELQMFIESEFGFLPPARSKKILGGFLNIGVKRFSSGSGVGSGSILSLGDTDDEFEEERASALKAESKLQAVIKNLDKEIRARRGKSPSLPLCHGQRFLLLSQIRYAYTDCHF